MAVSFSGVTVEYDDYKENSVIIKVVGYLDTYNSIDFYRYIINEIIEKKLNFDMLILDLSMLNYASSTGIGSIMQIMKTLIAYEKLLSLYRVHPSVKNVMDLLGFSNFFNFCNDLDKSDCIINSIKKRVKD